jgi:hypothetical protein
VQRPSPRPRQAVALLLKPGRFCQVVSCGHAAQPSDPRISRPPWLLNRSAMTWRLLRGPPAPFQHCRCWWHGLAPPTGGAAAGRWCQVALRPDLHRVVAADVHATFLSGQCDTGVTTRSA